MCVPPRNMDAPISLGRKAPARGTAILSKGFRPFFLLAALWAALAVPLWLLVQAGEAQTGAYFLPAQWHAHEMIFGFTAAVIAGFLLTAASNWTQRETATGPLLLTLCVIWVAGRASLLASDVLPAAVVAAANLAFLPAVAIVVGRAIVGAKSRRNYGIVLVLAALFGAQVLMHAGALRGDVALPRRGELLGLDLILVLIAVIGGRIIPLFTRNATKASDIRSSAWLDRLAIGALVLCAIADALLLTGWPLAVVTGAAAVLAALRARGWGARHALRDPLLLVLHVGYFFVPLGLALRAAAELTPRVMASPALHALTVGAIGLLTLGMMVRVALGHTGRPLASSRLTTIAFGLLAFSALARVAVTIGGRVSTPALHVAGTAWSLAFLLYLVAVGPALWAPRVDGRPG